jgi:transcriptional regulator GlxA family with amidase domain
LTRRRLETARTLLATTGLPVTQVCYESGFEDLSSFGRLFRQFSGLVKAKNFVSRNLSSHGNNNKNFRESSTSVSD